MAVAAYGTDLADILLDMSSTTGWTAIGGGAAGLVAPETDFFIQGSNCISKAGWSAATKGMLYSAGTQTVPAGKAVFMWVYFWAANSLDITANGGLQVIIGSATGAYKQWYVSGKERLPFAGWVCVPVDPTLAASATTGAPSSTLSFFGALAAVPAAGPSKGQPLGIDAFRIGRELQCTLGDGTGYATFDGAATYGGDVTRRWGLLFKRDGAYFQQGLFLMGATGTACDFRDSNRIIFIQDALKVSSGFNAFEVRNAGSNVAWTNITITALGTVSRGDFITTADAPIALTGCVFTDMGAFGFLGNTTATTTVFRRCQLITKGAALLQGCTFDSTADATRAVTETCPNLNTVAGSLSGSTFKSGGTKHGLEVTGTAANFALTNVTWTGYASADGSSGNEAIFINIVSGTVNITVNGGTTPSIRTAGAIVNVISGAVNVLVKCVTAAGANVPSVRVLLLAAAGAGPFPVDVTVTIANSGTTATVTHTSHGLLTNDKVQIKGASHYQNNGVWPITKTDANTYTYTMTAAPGSDPSGTIKATFAVLSGLTDTNGEITMTRVFSSAQPVTGKARKSTSAPLYKTGSITGSVSNTLGFSATVTMILDG